MPRSIQGKSAIVTGAGSGINLEFARLLLENGANVLLADLALRPEAQQVIEKYREKPKAIFQRTDVTSWNDLTAMFRTAEQEFGSIEIVCPGAGVFEPLFSGFWYPPGGPESKDDPFGNHYKSLEINLTHPIRVTQMAISHFLATAPTLNTADPKTIIHVASVAGESASISYPLYFASKWGLVGFIHSFASLEETMGIRVAAVAPGTVRTPLWDVDDKAAIVTTKEGVLQPNWITPEHVAEIMLGLVTGQQFQSLDGSKIEVGGGLILEVGASHVRQITMMDNPGPATDQPGMSAVNGDVARENAFAQLRRPGWGRLPKPSET